VKRGRLIWVIGANLVGLVTIAFIYPHLMVSPGALVEEHAYLATDCFACHAPWRGASSQRCVSCHGLPDIGLRTTKGAALPQSGVKTAFHQELIEQDCMACHSDHAGPKLTQRSRKPFSHALLRIEVQQRCVACHARPADRIHKDLTIGCAQCHSAQRWKPATFDHALLTKAQQAGCDGCHKAPADALHRQLRGNCAQCHTQDRWKPATFDHAKSFVLDRDHDTKCETCHINSDYSRYTCYGCHEHTPAKVREEHAEEGIQNFEDCAECHRDPRAEPERRGGTRSEGKRERD
jgi:hypothetical protein